MLKFKGMILSFLQGFFFPINYFCFILQNTLRKIELFAECLYLFCNCCLGYRAMEGFQLRNEFLLFRHFTKMENLPCKQSENSQPVLA